MSLKGAIYGSTIYTRAEIGLVPPRSTTGIPNVEMTTVHYAGPSDWGSSANRSSPAAFRDSTSHARCDDIMRSHQNFHMNSRGWSDYAYNGAACPHGFGFIGRGKGVRSAAQGTTEGNNLSYAIQYMGAGVHNGVEDPLTEEAKRAFYDMAAYLGMPLKRGHRDWKSTSCPGEPTYAWRRAGFPKPLVNGDDMIEADHDRIAATMRVEMKRLAQYLALGQGNQAFPGTETVWFGANAVTNPELLAAVRGVSADVNEQELAQAILAGLNPVQIAQAVVAAIGPDLAEDVVTALGAKLAA